MAFEQLAAAHPVDFGKDFISFISDATPDRIDLQYYRPPQGSNIYAHVQFGHRAQGPPGHAHGGAISAVFDELMGACCWINGLPAMTAQYTTRYFKPLPLRQEVLFEAHVHQQEGAKISLKASVTDGKSCCYAEASGLFILQDMETFKRMSQLDVPALSQYQSLEKQNMARKES